ncbi:MAG TPA: glycosyltransferase family 39 protein, partial [Polyangia bacterium]
MFDWVVRVCRTAVAILRREGGQERWRLLIRIAVVLALAGFCAETRGLRLNFSYDSTYYWSATRALLAGAPLTSQLYFSERIARASNDERIADLHQWVTMEAEPQEGVVPREVHPWTAWPPGFPLLAGGFFALLPLRPAAWACQAVALACFLMLVAAVARAMRGERFAFVATVIVAGLPAVHEVARVFSSDLWFMDCVLLALWSTLRWRESQRTRWLLLASGAAAASFTFRYLGLITCVWVVAQCGPRIRDLVRASIIPTLVVIPIVLRNQWLTGHWGGVQRLPSDRGWGANLLDTAIGALTGALPLVREVPGKLDLVLSAAAVGVLVFGLVGALRESRLAKVRSNGMGLLLGFSGLYAVALIAIRSRVLTDEIGQRLLLPVIVLVALAGLAKLAERLRTDVAKRWLVLAVPAYGVAVGASSAFSSQA